MKIEQNRKFEPITITLETIEEVYAMWHRMNLSWETLEPYTNTRKVPFTTNDLDLHIFNFLDKVIDNYKENL